MSAAIDGIKIAEAMALSMNKAWLMGNAWHLTVN
jgi:hypothetical protein